MRRQPMLLLPLIFVFLAATLLLLPKSRELLAANTAAPQPFSSHAAPLEGIVQVAVGGLHTCALTSGGGVKCWGENNNGQLGDGTYTDRTTPTDVVGLTDGVTAIVAGEAHTCALTNTGGVKCWGVDFSGALGTGNAGGRKNTPMNVAGLSRGVKTITAGTSYTCALLTIGGAMCWGSNSYSQLGRIGGDFGTPGFVIGMSSGVNAISAGNFHTCVVTTGGAVKCWGGNFEYQLGDGTQTERSTPVEVTGLSSGITTVAAGASHTCALTTAGAVKCWGNNAYSKLGISGQASASTPVDVTGLNSGVTALSVGKDHNCVITLATGVKCWGRGLYGPLGNNSILDQASPVDVIGLTAGVTTLDAHNSEHTCAVLTASGSVKCWGHNNSGQLGDGSLENRLTPVDVLQATTAAPTNTPIATSTPSLGNRDPLQGIVQVAVGSLHTCIVTNSGGAKCWGDNNWGQLGDDTNVDRNVPTDVVGLGNGVAAIVAGESHTCALMTTGGVKCWGVDFDGQLGTGNAGGSKNKPENVAGLSSGVKAIKAGKIHTCALLTMGGLMCWGNNSYSQLGRTGGDLSTPGFVTGLSSGVNGISAGDLHTCAVTTSGAVKCWGRNIENQLGDGTQAERAAPVDVSGLSSGITAVDAGRSHTCALTTTGAVKCWGSNAYSQLGISGQASAGTPVDVTGLSTATLLSVGKDHNCVLTSTNGVKCWGRGLYGALGNDSILDQIVPVDVISLTTGITTLDASNSEHTCAVLTTSGGVKCWGRNDASQLGDGSQENRLTPVDVVTGSSAPPTITPTPTAPATSTTTPTSTATNTATPPPGSTFTPTATPTIPPSGVGDAYEEDNTCQQARSVLTTGTLQEHTFHTTGDADWVRFDTTAGLTYRIEVQLPARSRADVDLALYAQCDAAPRQTWQKPFTPGVRLDFPATTAGPVYLQLTNAQAEVAGADVAYTLSVRPLIQQGPENALIVVAGRYKVPDALQANIHHVTNAVYKVFQGKGYTDDRIYYLATDANLPGYDALATEANLQQAITTWAKGRVGTAGVLTLYLMDHGDSGSFYLDEPNQQRLTPGELDGWLTTLEQAVPGVKINVIIEACYAGSFIKNAQSLSKPGRQRVIITSTDSGSLAYASQTGAHFSDHFLVALRQGRHLFGSFWEARAVVNEGLTFQTPWLDGNGDGTPNQIEDAAVAIERGFTAGTLDTEEWPPFIVTAQITATASPERRIIQAEVRDNQEVTTVWAVIYPPSYQPPTDSFELVPEILPTVLLLPQGNDRYAAEYPGFTEVGIYRIVLHAKDEANLEARPFLLTNRLLFLPMISRW